MLADLIRSVVKRRSHTRRRALSAQESALLVLTGAAVVSFLLYWLTFVQPYNLSALRGSAQLDLQRVALRFPNAPWLLLAAFVELGLVYLLAWRAAVMARGRAAWLVVIGGAVALSAALLFLFPFGADDIFDNIMHGRMIAIYGANPFVQVIAQFGRDPIAPYVGWATSVSAYGPLWEMLAGLTAWLTVHLLPGHAANSVVANVIAFKLLNGLFLAGSGWLTWAILRRVAPRRALAGVLLLTWNPVVLYETIGQGHNDIVMLFFVLAAVWLLLERRYALTIVALVLGGLIKFIPVLLIPAAGLVALRDLSTWRDRLRFVVSAAVVSIALVLVAYVPFWHGKSVLSLNRREHMYTTSLGTMAYVRLAPIWGPDRAGSTISKVLASLTGGFAVAMAVRAYHDRSWASFARSSFFTLIFYLLVTCPWFQNWYTIWPLGLAILLPRGYAARLGHVFAFSALAKPLIAAPLLLWPIPTPPEIWREMRLAPAVLAVAWLYALYGLWVTASRLDALEASRAAARAAARPCGRPDTEPCPGDAR
jgi:hypothetical protein